MIQQIQSELKTHGEKKFTLENLTKSKELFEELKQAKKEERKKK